MENAVIHGMAEKIRIRVDAGKHWVRFSVSDDGAGIPQEKLEHLCGDYMELADTTIIGTTLHPRIRRMISTPSISGSPRSRIIKSGQ